MKLWTWETSGSTGETFSVDSQKYLDEILQGTEFLQCERAQVSQDEFIIINVTH